MKVLCRTLLLLLLILTLHPSPLRAQIPSWLAVTPDSIEKPPGNACFTIIVGDGAYMTVDLGVRLPSGSEEIFYASLTLDGNGEGNMCANESTEEGLYIFTGVQNSEYSFFGLVPTWAPLWINAAPAPPPPPPSAPALTALGTACENWDCIWGVGANFNE